MPTTMNDADVEARLDKLFDSIPDQDEKLCELKKRLDRIQETIDIFTKLEELQ